MVINSCNNKIKLEKIVIKRHYLNTLVKDENIDKLLNLKEDDDIFKVFINKIEKIFLNVPFFVKKNIEFDKIFLEG